MDLYNGELFKKRVPDYLAINNLKIYGMPVDVKKITDERLQSWSKQLVNAHATPVLLLGVGHDHVSGQIHVVVTEDMTPEQIRTFLKAALKSL